MEHVEQLNINALLSKLPKREPQAHKGNFGHVLIIGGDFGYPGAPVLAALGALRVGCGLVTIASHKEHIMSLNATYPEIMCLAIDNVAALTKLFAKATVIVLGPGLGRTQWSQAVYDTTCDISQPVVLDADALYFLAQAPKQTPNRILTPHPGEAATLLHQQTPIATNMRYNAMHELISKYAATVVLKGMHSLVGSPKTNIGICNYGNAGMASGGMGDLLSGVIAGLVAQGLDLDTAAKLGVCIHAKAGDLAATNGQRGLIATDLLVHIKNLVK